MKRLLSLSLAASLATLSLHARSAHAKPAQEEDESVRRGDDAAGQSSHLDARALFAAAAAPVPPTPPMPPMPPFPPEGSAGGDSLEEKLFSPDLIMSHQKELAITDAQRTAIIGDITKAQGEMLQGQWQLQAATELLSTLLDATPIDEPKAIAQSDKVMNLERDVKKANLTMLIRIKNQLTPAQQKKLEEARSEDRRENFPFTREQREKLRMLSHRMRDMGQGHRGFEIEMPAPTASPAAPK